MAPKILVGTAGSPMSSKTRETVSGIRRIRELGLDALEVPFTYGVRMDLETAGLVAKAAKKDDVYMTVHGPYYINLNAREHQKMGDSERRIIESARVSSIFGGHGVVFHPGFFLDKTPAQTLEKIAFEMKLISDVLEDESIAVPLLPETTGKYSAFGSLEETMALCEAVEGVKPTIDFSHLWARAQGKLDYHDVLAAIERRLGHGYLEDLHMHLSGIVFTDKGEKNHVNLADCALDAEGLAAALKEFHVGGSLISESPNIEGDALKFQKMLQR